MKASKGLGIKGKVRSALMWKMLLHLHGNQNPMMMYFFFIFLLACCEMKSLPYQLFKEFLAIRRAISLNEKFVLFC